MLGVLDKDCMLHIHIIAASYCADAADVESA